MDNINTRLRKRIRAPDDASHSTEEQHEEEKSAEQLAHECGMCKKVYSREFKLKQHERLEHGIQIVRQCGLCMRPGEWLFETKRHQIVFASTGKASHQCTVCFKLFTSCSNNWDHQKTHSETDVPATLGFQCKGCYRIMASKMTLQRHIDYACPADNISAMLGMKYRCQTCFELLPNEKSWNRHQIPGMDCSRVRAAAAAAATRTSEI